MGTKSLSGIYPLLDLAVYGPEEVKSICFCGQRLTRVSCGQHNDQPPLLYPTNVRYPSELGGLRVVRKKNPELTSTRFELETLRYGSQTKMMIPRN